MNFYRCKHFKIQELVPVAVHLKYGDRAWQFLDPDLCRLIDLMRERYGMAFINRPDKGVDQRGLRTEDGISDPSIISMHYQGKAADKTYPGSPAEEIRQDLYKMFSPDGTPGSEPIAQLLRGVEDGVSWVHVDVRNSEKLVRFKK